MVNLEALSAEMLNLNNMIKKIMDDSGYNEDDDLAAIDGYYELRSPDDLQKLEEYRSILSKLHEIQWTLDYMRRPIREVSRIHKNKEERYETESGVCFTSGCCIEFLRMSDIYNYQTNQFEEMGIWTISSIEYNFEYGDYFIVGFPDTNMSGLKVRIRG